MGRNGYFILSKTPEELRLPLVFLSISDPFAKRWMLTACGQLKSYDDFKKAFSELLWDGTRRSEIRCQVYQGGYTWGESLRTLHYIRQLGQHVFASHVQPGPTWRCDKSLRAEDPNYLISANLKLVQVALAFLTKLQSVENSR